MSAVSDAVTQALSSHDVVGASSGIKDAVCDELSRADTAATIRRTEYFNHSYVPDVVMNWSDGYHREVFLRFSSAERLSADVDRIGQSGPVLFDLTIGGESELKSAVGEEALGRAPAMLVTDTEASEQVRPDQAENMLERLVSSNVFRAGHGLLDGETVEQTLSATRSGFDGAVAGNPSLVRAALASTRPIFGLGIERRVERTLQLLWWVGGADEQQFPLSLPDDMELDADDMREFLRMVFSDDQPVGDGRFWNRLSDRLDFGTLVSVGSVKESENLNSLMAAYSSRVQLSHAVVDLRDRPMPPYDAYGWELDDGFVVLSGPDWDCRMTPSGNRFSQRRDEGKAVPLEQASARSLDYRVVEAEFDEKARQVSLSRKAAQPGAPSQRTLEELAEGFDPSSQVRKLTVVSEASRLTVDFERMLVGADPDVSLRAIAEAASVLLADVREGDLDDLQWFLG